MCTSIERSKDSKSRSATSSSSCSLVLTRPAERASATLLERILRRSSILAPPPQADLDALPLVPLAAANRRIAVVVLRQSAVARP